ncbi:MAG: PKD domain-containing protein [Planctomycetes bacterium]|nr:PKD domain-containing protein [Planctomycetota bacterium]
MKRIGIRRIAVFTVLAALAAATGVVSGCGPTPWRTDDGRIVTGKLDFQKEPVTGRVYHLYIPTSYNPRRQYPLVVTAQGTFPFDQAAGQRDRWIEVAERYGLIVCSADFDSATGWLGVPEDRPAPELVRDDEATMAIIRELKSRYSINPDAIMISGWSGGGYPAHYIGLNHPDVFRCIVGRTANFKEHLVSDDVARRARHMHIYVFFGEGDLPGFDQMNRDANFWYTVRGFRNFVIRQLPGGHNPNQVEAARYFLNIVSHWPAVHVEASQTDGVAPLTVRFRALVRDPDSPDGRVDSVLWNLGDNTVSAKAEVTHTYSQPGVYNVFLTVVDLDGHHEYAQTWIRVR